jgi:uncharacterized coiled-coil protein SlyX
MTKSLSEFHRSVDEKIGKGLAVVLSSSDRKIDKGLAAIQEAAGAAVKSQQDNGSVKDLERRMNDLEHTMAAVQERPDVSKEVLNALVELRATVDRLSARTTRIEQYLTQMSKRAPPPPTR